MKQQEENEENGVKGKRRDQGVRVIETTINREASGVR